MNACARPWRRQPLCAVLSASLGVLVCCGPKGTTGKDGPAGADALIRTRDEPPGDPCPDGGVVIEYGNDQNDDHRLDDDEVSGSSVVCHGRADDNGCTVSEETDGSATISCADGTRVTVANGVDGLHGLPALVDVEEEPEGDRCPRGGSVIYAGTDANEDGVLAAEEVSSVQYLCSGDALSGVALVRMDPEPVGVNCPVGGTAVKSGVDLDNNGTLEDTEVLQTAFVCTGPPVVVEDGVLQGDYVIENSVDVGLLAGVREITGSLTLGAPLDDDQLLTRIALPTLVSVGDDLDFRADNLYSLDLSALEEARGRLVIAAPLDEFILGRLREIGRDLGIYFTHVSDLGLDSVEVGITGIGIGSNDSLLRLPPLSWISVLDSLEIRQNPLLPNCYATRILDQLDEEPEFVNIADNGAGACD